MLMKNDFALRENNNDRNLLKQRNKEEMMEGIIEMKVPLTRRDFNALWNDQNCDEMRMIDFLKIARKEGLVH